MEDSLMDTDTFGRGELRRSLYCSREYQQLQELACHIRTGCVYEAQPSKTWGILVTRTDPRTRHGTLHGRRQVRAPIQVHWPLFAPSMNLLSGQSVSHTAIPQGWPAFSAAYQAELEEWPFLTRMAIARQVMAWMHTYPTVTILSFERRMPAGSTPDYWSQRDIFRNWLVSLLPLAMPLGSISSGNTSHVAVSERREEVAQVTKTAEAELPVRIRDSRYGEDAREQSIPWLFYAHKSAV